MAKIAGKIIVRPMGEYSDTTMYDVLDMVTRDNKVYISKKKGLIGISPSREDISNWLFLLDGDSNVKALESAINLRFEEMVNRVDFVNELLDSFTITINNAVDTVRITATTALDNAATAQSTADTAVGSIAITDKNLNDHKTFITTELERIQGEIDGAITTHFFAYSPGNDSVPTSDWTTDESKNIHLGDLFYDTDTGYCYRWVIQNGVYSWIRIADVDVTKALSDSTTALNKATDALAKVIELETKLSSLTFKTNVDTGNLEWGYSN